MRKIKLAHLVNVLSPSGKEKKLLKIVSQMDPERFDVHIVVFSTIRFKESLDLEPFNIHLLKRGSGNSLKLLPQLIRLFKKERFDIIYSHSWNTLLEGYLAGVAAGIPVKVHGEHGTFERSSVKDRLQKFIWGRFDAVTVVAADLEKKMRATFGYRKNNVQTLYNGTDLSRFVPCEESRKDFRNQNYLDDNFVIGTVGRFHPVKDHPTLIRGFARFHERVPEAHLIFVGGEPPGMGTRKRYEVLVESLGISNAVTFFPITAEPQKFINGLDVFVLSSISEGCSNVILEAAACGVPIIATDTGGNPELVQDNETGLLFDVGDAAMLSDKLQILYERAELRKQLGMAGMERIHKNFSLESAVVKYEQFYTELCQKLA